jgi:hypothetical protein
MPESVVTCFGELSKGFWRKGKYCGLALLAQDTVDVSPERSPKQFITFSGWRSVLRKSIYPLGNICQIESNSAHKSLN